jgi:hypothetical protein
MGKSILSREQQVTASGQEYVWCIKGRAKRLIDATVARCLRRRVIGSKAGERSRDQIRLDLVFKVKTLGVW